MYFNAGTRRSYRPALNVTGGQEFIPAETMTYLAFFQGDERGGRPYETWTGSLGTSLAATAGQTPPGTRLDRVRPWLPLRNFKATCQRQRPEQLPLRRPGTALRHGRVSEQTPACAAVGWNLCNKPSPLRRMDISDPFPSSARSAMFAALSRLKFHSHLHFHLSAFFPVAAVFLMLLGVLRVTQLLVAPPGWYMSLATPLFESFSSLMAADPRRWDSLSG